MKKIIRIIVAIILFICVFASLMISCQIFYNQGIVIDEKGISADQLYGGRIWLYMVWVRLLLLSIASAMSFWHVIKAIREFRK